MTFPNTVSGPGLGLLNRRGFLRESVSGLGAIALTSLLADEGKLKGADEIKIDPAQPYAPRAPHFPAAAKNIIVVFCAGAVSQLETWDYKPELAKWDGRALPDGPAVTFQGPAGMLARPQYPFRQHGETGKWVSDLVPHLAELTDEFAYVHSLTSDSNTHGPAENFLSTGNVLDGFPSLGAWVTYALGSENQNLPSYVAIPDPRGVPQNGSNNWGPGFLPAAFQGTTVDAKSPVRYLEALNVSEKEDRAAFDLLRRLNGEHLKANPEDQSFAARIASYELAARMQLSVPEVMDLSQEEAHVLKMYGADDSQDEIKAAFARNCILARRMVEKGVRFVQLFNGAYASGGRLNWDGHNALKEQYDTHARIMDQPVAALIRDLKQRGLLEETLVVWCTEFGRMPFFQKGSKGRDHNPDGFTCWLAGAGVNAGVSHGKTDELGRRAIENVHPLYHFNATLLHLLGLDFERLTFEHNGIERRLTNVEGKLIKELIA